MLSKEVIDKLKMKKMLRDFDINSIKRGDYAIIVHKCYKDGKKKMVIEKIYSFEKLYNTLGRS